MRSIFTALILLTLFSNGLQAGTPQVPLPDTNIYPSVVLTDENGKEETFTNVEVREVEPDALTIVHEKGGYRVPFEMLPKEWQDRYGLDAESAAAYRAEQEDAEQARQVKKEAARERAEAIDEIDDGSLWIRVESIVSKDQQGTIVAASQLIRETIQETHTNTAKGMKGPMPYSQKDRERERQRRVTAAQLNSNPGTKLEKNTPSAPTKSSVSRHVETWEPLGTKIVLVESPDLESGWTGRVYPCGVSGENYPRYASTTAIALAWKDRKPGMSILALKNGFLDAVLSPGKIFKVNGMTFTPPALRNLTYWVGIALGALVYLLIAIVLSKR